MKTKYAGTNNCVRTFSYELFFNPEQEQIAELYAKARNISYNYAAKCLEEEYYQRIDDELIEEFETEYDFNDLSKRMTQWRHTHPVVSKVPFMVMNGAFDDVKKSYCNNRKRICGRPKPKDLSDSNIKQTFQLYKNLNGKPFIEKINKKKGRTYLNRTFKWVFLELGREWDNPRLKKLTIKKDRGKWYYIAVVETKREKHHKNDGSIAGVDRNANRTLAYHNGEFKDMPAEVEVYAKKASAIQAKLDRMQPGSNRYKKLEARKNAYHYKETNAANGFIEESVHDTVTRFDKTAVEDLKLTEMAQEDWGGKKKKKKSKSKREVNGKMSRGRHGRFVRKLEERTDVVKVAAPYTSQDCPNADCGHRSRNNRKTQEVFDCEACGRKTNADTNAAINIRKRGLLVAGQIPTTPVKGRITASNMLAVEQRLAEALATNEFKSGKLSLSSPSAEQPGGSLGAPSAAKPDG